MIDVVKIIDWLVYAVWWYSPYANKATERAKEFVCNEDEIMDNIGTSVWKLIESLKSFGND